MISLKMFANLCKITKKNDICNKNTKKVREIFIFPSLSVRCLLKLYNSKFSYRWFGYLNLDIK